MGREGKRMQGLSYYLEQRDPRPAGNDQGVRRMFQKLISKQEAPDGTR